MRLTDEELNQAEEKAKAIMMAELRTGARHPDNTLGNAFLLTRLIAEHRWMKGMLERAKKLIADPGMQALDDAYLADYERGPEEDQHE